MSGRDGLRVAFDETLARGRYIGVAAVYDRQDAAAVSAMVCRQRREGQRRFHAHQASRGQIPRFVDAVIVCDAVGVWLYDAEGGGDEARHRVLRKLAIDASHAGAERLVLDGRDLTQNCRDRQVIADAVAGTPYAVRHEKAGVDRACPGLEVADVVAWAYQRGGELRRRIMPIVRQQRRLDRHGGCRTVRSKGCVAPPERTVVIGRTVEGRAAFGQRNSP